MVLTHAHVANVITQPNGDGTVTATGIKFLHAGNEYRVDCSTEVCLCAG